jgi:hypothetical protein
MKLALTEQAADKLGDIFTSYIKKKIKERIYPYGNPEVKGTGNKFASGKLYNSISYEVVPEGEDSFVNQVDIKVEVDMQLKTRGL